MKKLVLLFSLLLSACIGNAQQTITFVNNTLFNVGFQANMDVCIKPPANASVIMVGPLSSVTYQTNTIPVFAGAPTPTSTFDVVKVIDGCITTAGAIIGEPCSGFPLSDTYTSACNYNTVTATWNNTNPMAIVVTAQ